MADDLPEDFDVIVLGTGFPESVVAAALSRIGMKVLHLDRNDCYSDQWVTFTFESLLKWIELNQNKDHSDAKEVHDEPQGTGNHTNEAPSLETGTYSVPVPSHSNEISNVVVKSYFSEKQPQQDSVEPQAASQDVTETDTHKSTVVPSGPPESTESIETAKLEPNDKTETSQEADTRNNASTEENSTATRASEGTDDLSSGKSQDQSVGNLQSEEDNETPTSIESGAEDMSRGKNEREVPKDVDSAASVQVPFVPPQRERSERRPAIGVNMTYDDLKPYWRRFNIDISPKLLFSRGSLVEALISANISHYAEFKSITRILTYMDGRVEEVPCSRADVFSSSVISIVEKRMLMKFLTFCLDFEQQQDQYEGFHDQPYAEFLQSRRLTPNLQHFIIHAIAMVKPETSTLQGLKATQSFLQSLGRYGNTPFIWPLYGAGEMPQAFCRMCAVFGGLYCLRRGASAIAINEANCECTGIISDNQLLKCKWLISGHSYVPENFRKECTQYVSRAVFITCSSVKASEEEFITVLSMPPSSAGGEPVRVIELGPTTMACPKGLYVVHLICKSSSSAKDDLEPTANKLFHFPSEGDVTSDKPTALWSLYFNQASPDPSSVTDLPSNVHVLSLPGISLGFGEALQQAKEVFERICPGEEFLQAVPNPEDIILDDFLQQDGNHNTAETGGEAQADAVDPVDPGSGDEERSAAGMAQEQAEGDVASSEASDGNAQVDAEPGSEAQADGVDTGSGDEERSAAGMAQEQAEGDVASSEASDGNAQVDAEPGSEAQADGVDPGSGDEERSAAGMAQEQAEGDVASSEASDGNAQVDAEPGSEAQADAVDPGSGDEERSAAGMAQEQAEGDVASREAGDGNAQVDAGGREESSASEAGQEQAGTDQASRQFSEEDSQSVSQSAVTEPSDTGIM